MKVYCLGELLIDMIGEEDGPGGPAVFRKFAGGAAGNVAVGLAKLGMTPAVLARVGADFFGAFLLDTLKHYGVDISAIVRDPQRRTTLAFVTHDASRKPSYLFYRENSASAAFCLEDLRDIRFTAEDALYLSSLPLAHEPIRTASFEALRRADEAGAVVVFDPNIRLSVWQSAEEVRAQVFRALPFVRLLKVNDDELRFLFGDGPFEALCQRALERFPKLELVAVTLGEKGALLANRAGTLVSVPAVDLPVVDTCGAGDTFCATMLYMYHTQGIAGAAALRRLGVYANSAAHLTSMQEGVIPAMPLPNQIDAFIRKYHAGTTL